MPATFGDVYERLCEQWPDPQERGRRFEPLVAQVLETTPLYAQRFAKVWRWTEWPARRSGDIGVDLVAQRFDGGLTAIQVKCYDPGATLHESQLATFLANTNADFDERLVVSTTPRWSRNLLALIERQQPPVQRLDLFGLEATTIDWDRYLEDEAAPLAERPRKTPRPHQTAALAAVRAGLEDGDRGKLVMACGTGKTYTALRAAEELAGRGGRVLFAAPSISLVAQGLREWTADASLPIRAFAVCSDPRVGRADEDGARTYDLPIPAATDPARLAEAAAADAPGALTVVFSTYQSMGVVRDAQDAGMPGFDLAVCDEAHRTTGYALDGEDPSSFLLVHDAAAIRARKRLYMTATPRIYAPAARAKAAEADAFVASMDNEETYGPELHRLGFAEAVERELLSDYKVAILVVDEAQIAREYQAELAGGEGLAVGDVGRVIGCLNGLAKLDPEQREFHDDPSPMRSAVAFSNTIAASKRFTDLVGQLQDEAGRARRGIDAEARHVDGKSGVLERARQLEWLGAPDRSGAGTLVMERQCHVLSNARCLTEGIDVPALDAVLFLQPRKSQIDVVQAVGRVMRRAEGKRYGYVILPVVVPAGDDLSAALDRSGAYAHVWEVLQALRSHDERFDAWVNKLDLNRSRADAPVAVIGVGPRGGGGEDDGDAPSAVREQAAQYLIPGLEERVEQWREAIYAKIVERCGERRYWEQWSDSVAGIARRHHERIRALIAQPTPAGKRFSEFVAALRRHINDSVTHDDAAAMLSQHLVTAPVFDALFGGSEFTARNPVSQAMQRMADDLDDMGLEAETEELAPFYDSVRRRADGIDNAEGRQRVAAELYDRFFRTAYRRDAERLGIVYTPIEIVDFIVRAVADLLRDEFGASLGDEGVHVLDPFTGTGAFVARLLQSGLIPPDDLPRKYRHEIHANEIMLLAYYIAAVNIESAYRGALATAGRDEPYEPFPGIVLADTFQSAEPGEGRATAMFPRNSERIERQLGLDIRVILGNPPWSAQQRSENDNNPNLPYPHLDESIRTTYAERSAAKLKNALYDSYVRGIRWASDRVLGNEGGGIVAYVTNGGFIDSTSFDGFRKTLAREFHAVHVYNLRGNQRTSGEQSKREGGKVFGSGSRAGVAILLLVKRPAPVPETGADIRYRDIGDYLTRERKLEIVAGSELGDGEWEVIAPNDHGDWIRQRSQHFPSLRALLPQDATSTGGVIAELASYGVNSGRDRWAYNFSSPRIRHNIGQAVEFFNAEVDRVGRSRDAGELADRDPQRFSWDRKTRQRLERGERLAVDDAGYRVAMYRPFTRSWMYLNVELNASPGVQLDIFPVADENWGMFVASTGGTALAVNAVPDLHMITPDGRFIPRYVYDEPSSAGAEQGELTPRAAIAGASKKRQRSRRDNITDEALAAYGARYGEDVTKDDVFAYVYGVLHSPEYRERYATDLAKMLPRIPQVATAPAFRAFAEAGQRLLDLHIGYEQASPHPLREEWAAGAPAGDARWRVEKMRWAGTRTAPDRSAIVVSEWLTLSGIPDEAHEYVVGPRSALEWLIDRYRVRVDKASGIVNDPNDWGLERGEPSYIAELVKRIVTVSVETMRVVRALPPLDEA